MADWQQQHQLRPTHWQLDEFDPAKPRAVLLGEAQADRDDGAGTRSIYRGHGRQQSAEQGRQRAQVRVEAEQAARAQWHGRTRAWNLGAGHLFELEGCPQTGCNRQYLVVASELDVIEAAPGSVTASAGPSLQCRLQVLDSRVPYRSPADTRWPRIAGLQSAIVAGDNDEDIAVDAQGRVNVHFHWSRAARSHGRVSCPVRVATSWAGKGWGRRACRGSARSTGRVPRGRPGPAAHCRQRLQCGPRATLCVAGTADAVGHPQPQPSRWGRG
ncbi:type VI secretion system tip protein VgrG [Stenotrophomonas sp. CD2]|nr:type VI secretion system tip protein VgrG [Stenotrophomonas sp. CD2]